MTRCNVVALLISDFPCPLIQSVHLFRLRGVRGLTNQSQQAEPVQVAWTLLTTRVHIPSAAVTHTMHMSGDKILDGNEGSRLQG